MREDDLSAISERRQPTRRLAWQRFGASATEVLAHTGQLSEPTSSNVNATELSQLQTLFKSSTLNTWGKKGTSKSQQGHTYILLDTTQRQVFQQALHSKETVADDEKGRKKFCTYLQRLHVDAADSSMLECQSPVRGDGVHTGGPAGG